MLYAVECDGFHIRAAEVRDVPNMERLLNGYANRGVLLPRTQDDIFQHLQEFLIAESIDNAGALLGVVALHVYESGLAEVRSLGVVEDTHGRGVGRALLAAVEAWAKELGVRSLFALTYVDGFFLRHGYQMTAKESLPHKIWTVCVHCEKFSHCDEIAVRKNLFES